MKRDVGVTLQWFILQKHHDLQSRVLSLNVYEYQGTDPLGVDMTRGQNECTSLDKEESAKLLELISVETVINKTEVNSY
ncbi:hypothetical protein QTG56_09485 [Rossellomorea sp. AcN35-11]|nr:hypothetical protein [Rossellomorea aquimaris]NMH68484.1 hypothetical protein [Bacillus sp. RO3]WJV31169.1 hypothetical protein QTG56_09485 [Rossellomorea sp. AcN35-11]